MSFIKQNILVLLAFALPILLILGIAASTYLPGLFLSTEYDFIYATCGAGTDRYSYSYDCDQYLNQTYKVEAGKLIFQKVGVVKDPYNDKMIDVSERYTPRLFLHDTKSNASREITPDQTQGLALSSLLTSPDGVAVNSGYDRNNVEFFPFGSRSSNYGYYLSKGSKHRQLNLVGGDNYYSNREFKFIGWIINQPYTK